VGPRLLAPWNLTSQHSLILKRDRLHMHHMPTPYLSPKHPYAERANVLFAVMMSTGCSLCLGLDTFLWFSPPWQWFFPKLAPHIRRSRVCRKTHRVWWCNSDL
jgi:hypothetical protein